MNSFKLLLVLIFLCLSPGLILAQRYVIRDTTSKKMSFKSHFIGLNAGITTGLGVSYRFMPSRNGFQVTVLPIIDPERTYLSLAATYLREIKKMALSRFLFYASNHYTNMLIRDDRFVYNCALGVGWDYNFYEDFNGNFMIGYAGLDLLSSPRTRPTIEFGLNYSFN